MNIASRLWNAQTGVPFLFSAVQKWTAFSISKRKENFKSYEKDIEAISHRLPCLCDYRYRYPYNAEVELINPVADTVANANYRGADVEWYIKADDIVLKNKGGQPAGNPQNHAPQGQQKK